MCEIISKTVGIVKAADGTELKLNGPAPNALSVVYDAVVIPGGPGAAKIAKSKRLRCKFVSEAFSHYKPRLP